MGLSGSVEEPCWEGLPVAPNVFIVQDLLHGCYKFVWDHLAEWLSYSIGKKELDHQFKAQPKLGFHTFMDGIVKISQATGCEHKTYLQFILPVITGCKGLDLREIASVRTLIDYIYLAHYPVVSISELEAMEHLLADFHANKQVFILNGSQGNKGHLNIPKLHALIHYVTNAYQLGILGNFSPEIPESLHIQMCKEPYQSTNQHDYDHQILNYLDIQDHLTLHALYEVFREEKEVRPLSHSIIAQVTPW